MQISNGIRWDSHARSQKERVTLIVLVLECSSNRLFIIEINRYIRSISGNIGIGSQKTVEHLANIWDWIEICPMKSQCADTVNKAFKLLLKTKTEIDNWVSTIITSSQMDFEMNWFESLEKVERNEESIESLSNIFVY